MEYKRLQLYMIVQYCLFTFCIYVIFLFLREGQHFIVITFCIYVIFLFLKEGQHFIVILKVLRSTVSVRTFVSIDPFHVQYPYFDLSTTGSSKQVMAIH